MHKRKVTESMLVFRTFFFNPTLKTLGFLQGLFKD